MTALDVDGLRAAAEAATTPMTCGGHRSMGSLMRCQECLTRANGASDLATAATPAKVLGLLDRLQAAEAAVERVRDLAGSLYWHGGGKGPDLARAIRGALDGPQDAATGEVALGSADEPVEPQIAYKACSGSAGYPTEEKARDWCRLLNGTGGGFWFYWRCDAGHHHAGGVA